MHFRKFSPIDKEYPIFELVEGEEVLLDIAKNDAGIIEVAFHGAIQFKMLALDIFEQCLAQGRALVEHEKH